jgi:hypothetical protein
MTRPSDITRERVLKAAQRLFADYGYKDTSVRAAVTRARVNQAAINYHFGGKEGLYRSGGSFDPRPYTHTHTHTHTRENSLNNFAI